MTGCPILSSYSNISDNIVGLKVLLLVDCSPNRLSDSQSATTNDGSANVCKPDARVKVTKDQAKDIETSERIYIIAHRKHQGIGYRGSCESFHALLVGAGIALTSRAFSFPFL